MFYDSIFMRVFPLKWVMILYIKIMIDLCLISIIQKDNTYIYISTDGPSLPNKKGSIVLINCSNLDVSLYTCIIFRLLSLHYFYFTFISFICLFIHSFIHKFIHSFIHSFIHFFIHSFIRPYCGQFMFITILLYKH